MLRRAGIMEGRSSNWRGRAIITCRLIHSHFSSSCSQGRSDDVSGLNYTEYNTRLQELFRCRCLATGSHATVFCLKGEISVYSKPSLITLL
jgi:hypothetical protein